MANLSNYKELLTLHNLILVNMFDEGGRKMISYSCTKHGVVKQRFDGFNGCIKCNKERGWNKTSKIHVHTIEDVRLWVLENSTAIIMSSIYVKQSEDLWFRCECGNGFRTSMNTFKQKNKRICDVCAEIKRSKLRQLKLEDITTTIRSISNCSFVSTSIKNKIRYVKLKCSCGNHFTVEYQNFKVQKYKVCIECSRKLTGVNSRYSIEFVREFIKSKNHKLISDSYTDANVQKLNILCHCGNTYQRTFSAFKSAIPECPECSMVRVGASRRISNDEVSKYLESFGLKLLSEYKTIKEKINIKCSCGNNFETTFPTIRKSNVKGCASCVSSYMSNKLSKSHAEFLEDFQNKISDDYEVISTYINSKSNIKIKHLLCDHIYEAKAEKVLGRGTVCPYCNMSKGEEKIFMYLEKNNVEFTQQHTFEDCRNVNKLPFDFAIFTEGDLKFLIEYDGSQHFEKNGRGFFGKIESYLIRKKRDLIKNKYCRENNIKLIRIPYWDFDQIKNILKYLLKR
jgi:hypothetical protein